LWGTAFRYINSASGVIENGEKTNTDVALISEAYFFRAYYYFQLVQVFGGVPLDLGAGELKFNTTTARTSVRNTVPEVYTRAVFPDLEKAVANLPETATTQAHADQQTPEHYSALGATLTSAETDGRVAHERVGTGQDCPASKYVTGFWLHTADCSTGTGEYFV
jgi:hypothetical protein